MNRSPTKSLWFAISCLLLLAPFARTQQPITLRVGTWNLEFLGDPANHRDKLPPRDDTDFVKIGQYLRALGPSVLAVQEICGAAPLRKVAAAAGPTWDLVLGTTGGWDDGKTAQNIGFLYDTARVELLSAEELLDFPRTLDNLPIFHRVPVTACFRDRQSGCDFRAVTVHLKASQKPDDLKKRKLEATVLRDWLLLLEADAHEDQDIVLLGDFNSTYGADPETVLETAGVVRYLRPAEPTPTILHFPEPIDQIAPSPRFEEVDRTSYSVHGPLPDADRVAWRKTYSDHFPVTFDLRASGDDDPQATFSTSGPRNVLPVDRRPQLAEPANATAGDDARTGAATAPSGSPARGRNDHAPLQAGDRVEVLVDAAPLLVGTLLWPLGEWVYLRDGDGRVRAIPAARVQQVRAAGH